MRQLIFPHIITLRFLLLPLRMTKEEAIKESTWAKITRQRSAGCYLKLCSKKAVGAKSSYLMLENYKKRSQIWSTMPSYKTKENCLQLKRKRMVFFTASFSCIFELFWWMMSIFSITLERKIIALYEKNFSRDEKWWEHFFVWNVWSIAIVVFINVNYYKLLVHEWRTRITSSFWWSYHKTKLYSTS